MIRKTAILACIVFMLVVSAGAAQAAESSASEQQFQKWLAAFNGGNLAALQEFARQNRADETVHVADDSRFREMTGGFEFKKAEENSPTKFVALLKEKDSDTFARISLQVDAKEPHKITSFQLLGTTAPAEFRIHPMAERDAIAALRKVAQERSASDQFSGAIAVSKHGTVIFEQAYGMADRSRKIPNRLDTQFRMGSMNKMFTATAILQLDQSGKLKLTDTLGQYLKDYPNKETASKVTLQELLNHTGGTGDIFGPEFEKNRLALKTLQDYVNLYGQRSPEFEPGSKWEYSNYGFILLGIVVEKASGKDYYDYVRQHIFNPAGMTGTDSLPEEQEVPKRAVGYIRSDTNERWTPNTDTLPYRGTSAGGGYTTVIDMLKFADALGTSKLLDRKHIELLTVGHAQMPNGPKYAYGFMDNRASTPAWFGHGVGAPGMNGWLRIFPQSGYVVTVLSNFDPPAADQLTDYASNRLPER